MYKGKRQWFSGKIQHCHCWAPGSIPGWRRLMNFSLFTTRSRVVQSWTIFCIAFVSNKMVKVVSDLSELIRLHHDGSIDHEMRTAAALSLWSDSVEEIILNPSAKSDEAITDDISSLVEQVSKQLLSALLRVLLGQTTFSEDQDCSIESFIDTDELCRKLLEKLRDSKVSLLERNDDVNTVNTSNEKTLFEVLRASQNWLRWYLQIFEPQLQVQNGTTTCQPLISTWRNRDALEIYLILAKKFSFQHPEHGRYASQLLFYSSYHPTTGIDDKLQNAYEYLANDCKMYQVLLESLLQTELTALQLSLVRVVHNALVSFPNVKRYVSDTKIDIEWLHSPASWVPKESQTKSMLDTLWDLTHFQLSQSFTESFPGTKDSRRAELLVEIQRTFYALKVGADIHLHEVQGQMILNILSLDSTNDQCYDCQLASLCVLMDSDPRFSETIVSSNIAQETLLRALEIQISQLLQNKNQIHDGAAATVIPILVVLHKYCQANTVLRKRTKEYIFPLSSDKEFQFLADAELSRGNGKPKNMKPLDSPPNSMRWKIIQLMTFPHSFVKRLVGELLWTLCDDNPDTFVLRTGLGNAMPFLGAKGIIPFPL